MSTSSVLEQKLFRLNSSKVGRLFELVIGNERVKSANLVELMLKQSLNKEEIILNNRSRVRNFLLDVTVENYEFFSKSHHKESLSIVFLQAASFVKAVKYIIKDHEKIIE